MKYKLTKRENPLNRTEEKWYATPVYNGKITEANIATEIVTMSSLSKGYVVNAIENFLDVLPKHLLMGKSVRLGELGTLRLSFSSEGVENPDEFNVGMIKGAKVIFSPGVELKKAIANTNFEKENKNKI
jgi:predicted histone-like DNA-binding protein